MPSRCVGGVSMGAIGVCVSLCIYCCLCIRVNALAFALTPSLSLFQAIRNLAVTTAARLPLVAAGAVVAVAALCNQALGIAPPPAAATIAAAIAAADDGPPGTGRNETTNKIPPPAAAALLEVAAETLANLACVGDVGVGVPAGTAPPPSADSAAVIGGTAAGGEVAANALREQIVADGAVAPLVAVCRGTRRPVALAAAVCALAALAAPRATRKALLEVTSRCLALLVLPCSRTSCTGAAYLYAPVADHCCPLPSLSLSACCMLHTSSNATLPGRGGERALTRRGTHERRRRARALRCRHRAADGGRRRCRCAGWAPAAGRGGAMPPVV